MRRDERFNRFFTFTVLLEHPPCSLVLCLVRERFENMGLMDVDETTMTLGRDYNRCFTGGTSAIVSSEHGKLTSCLAEVS